MTRQPHRRRRGQPRTHALTTAIARGEWERIALFTLVTIAEMVRIDPTVTIDDVLALFEPEGRDDA